MVPGAGLEPAWPCGLGILRPDPLIKGRKPAQATAIRQGRRRRAPYPHLPPITGNSCPRVCQPCAIAPFSRQGGGYSHQADKTLAAAVTKLPSFTGEAQQDKKVRVIR